MGYHYDERYFSVATAGADRDVLPMPVITAGGISTRYEVTGSGPPLLMLSPGGFNATLDNWSGLGIYRRLRLVARLAEHYTCILFDRREAGASGGKVERLAWGLYVAQARDLLNHLDVGPAHLLGGCAGCSVATAFAVAHPTSVLSMVLYSPAGGARYRMAQQARFGRHLAFAREASLAGVVTMATSSDASFAQDPRVGPWATVIRSDEAFARHYASLDPGRYETFVAGSARVMFDRDTVAGAEAEDLLSLDRPALIVPGRDDSHATSAARYLEECLNGAEYWDAPVEDQTEATALPVILDFLGRHTGG